MVAFALCPACQWGRHEDHVENWNPAPPGVLGGIACACPGGCTDKMGPLMKELFKDDDDGELDSKR